MIRALLVLALLAAGLLAWDAALARSASRERADGMRVGRFAQLTDPAHRSAGTTTRLTVTRSDGARFEYERRGEAWHCTSYHDAPAARDAIERLVTKAFEAEGLVATFDPAAHAAYGFEGARWFRVEAAGVYRADLTPRDANPLSALAADPAARVLGPAEPWSFAFDVGGPTPAGDAAYLRRSGDRAVWRTDQDPSPELASEPHAPPLLDPSLVPRAWLEGSRGVRRIEAAVEGGGALELELRERHVSEAEQRSGKSRYAWWVLDARTHAPGPSPTFLSPPGAEELRAAAEHPPRDLGDGYRPAHEAQAAAYSAFVMSAPYVEVLGRADRVATPPVLARVRLHADAGGVLELALSRRADGSVFVVNGANGLVYRTWPPLLELLAPRIDELLVDAQGRPWGPWLDGAR